MGQYWSVEISTAARERAVFAELFRATAHRVHAYAARHIDARDVDDVVAEVFLTAWRRRDRIDASDPMPWLLVTARNIIANRRRRLSARELPHVDLGTIAAPAASADSAVVSREAALSALATLTPAQREAVLLVAWDGLDNAGAARVAGCTQRAFTVRLHRARTRLARALDDEDQAVDHQDARQLRCDR